MSAACGTQFITLRKSEQDTNTIQTFPARCKRWRCPKCRAKKEKRYRKAIQEGFHNEQLYFYTFTFFHSKAPVDGWRDAAKAWNKLNVYIHQQLGRYKYVRVLESHLSSCYPHYHLLINTLIPATWLGPHLLKAGFGYQASIKRVNGQGAGNYVAKYLNKDWPRGDAALIREQLHLRIVSFSRGFSVGLFNRGPWSFVKFHRNLEGAIKYGEFVSESIHTIAVTVFDLLYKVDFSPHYTPPEFTLVDSPWKRFSVDLFHGESWDNPRGPMRP